MKKRLYIAYGSNLNIEQMAQRCPTAKLIGTSEIKDYELVFKGVATIEKKKGSIVPVCVWDLKKEDEEALDVYEGYPRLYIKENLRIKLNGKTENAMVYIMTPNHRLGMPSDHYLNIIAKGYEDNGLDVNVLDEAVKETVRKIEEERESQSQFNFNWRW